MTPAELRRLATLAEARKARDLARLEALIAEARRLEDEIAELAATERRDLAAGANFRLLAGRLAWAAAEIAARRRRIGAIALEIAAARAAARVSLGKHEALAALVERTAAEERAGREKAEEVAALVGRRHD